MTEMPCPDCENGWIELCDADGGNAYKVCCDCAEGERRRQNPRQRGDDDGIEYADPRDAMDERMFGGD